jgi:multicomponent Na+:H+ antiporter subunit C
MEPPLAILVGLFFATSVYLLLSRSLIRILLGVVVLSNAANLLIFTSGRILREVPPIIPFEEMTPPGDVANPLPQALILTAIVIAFALFIFILVLVFRAYQALGTDLTPDMQEAEPAVQPPPPQGY